MDALDPDYEDGFATFIEAAKEQRRLAQRLAKRKSPPGRTAHVIAPPSLPAYERDRAQALAEWLGHHVTPLPRIRLLREKLFAGRPLSANQANTLLTSPAPPFLSWDTCTTLGIPLIDHEARILKKEDTVTSTQRSMAVTLHITWTEGTYEGTFHWEEDITGQGHG